MDERTTAHNEIKKFADDMYNRYLEVSEAHTHIMQHQFEQVKHSLLMLDCDEQFKNSLEQITLGFEIFENGSSGCYGWENGNTIFTQTKSAEFINLNLYSYIKDRYKYTVMHEFSHMICWHFLKIHGHTLEFAIIMYCLENRLLERDSNRKNFLNSYDIADDRAYTELFLSPFKFDSVIRGIAWDSIEELAEKAGIMATRIRLKQAPYTVSKWEKEILNNIDKKDK